MIYNMRFMQRQIERPIPCTQESTGEPSKLPEGQYYVEKLLAQRRKVMYLYIVVFS